MKPRLIRSSQFVLALAVAASAGAVTATIAQDSTLVKPFSQYLINDVFPKAVNETFAETGRRWKASAEDILRDAEERKQSVASATTAKRSELAAAKAQLKQAKEEKDLVKIGAAEGIVRNEELSIDILKQLTRVAEKQMEVAQAWRETGSSIEKFTESDTEFDAFRSRHLTRPEPGQIDQRLGPDGYQAFRAQAAAMKDLGDAFRDLGSLTESLADQRLDLLETLAKGGHVVTSR